MEVKTEELEFLDRFFGIFNRAFAFQRINRRRIPTIAKGMISTAPAPR